MGGAHDRRGAEEKVGGDLRIEGVLKRKEGRGRAQDRRGAGEKVGGEPRIEGVLVRRRFGEKPR